MASRDPSPVLPDLSDPKVVLLKPFLDWAHRRLLALDVAACFAFSHPAFNVPSATARRLWPGYSAATWNTADGWMPRCVIPDDGTLASLTTQHGAHSGGASFVYTVWRSADGGVTWAATTLALSTIAASTAFRHVAGTVAVNRGDMIGVEVACTAVANGSDRLNATVAYRRAS